MDNAVREIGSNVTGVQGDAGNLADLDRLFETVKTEKSQIDVLYTNATAGDFGPLGCKFNINQAFVTKILKYYSYQNTGYQCISWFESYWVDRKKFQNHFLKYSKLLKYNTLRRNSIFSMNDFEPKKLY